MTTSRLFAAAAASALVVSGSVACAPPEKKDSGAKTESGVNAGEAISAQDFGGMDSLVTAGKAEGALNVIALPPDWANYKEVIDTFSSKYGIKVTSAQPDANSQDEINAAKQQKGKSTAPDVFDLGQAIALANTLNGDPTTASAAANGVLMAAIANGGSVDDIAAGVDFFGRLHTAAKFVPVDPTPATIESGQTPVVIDWDYLNSAETKKIPTWKVFVPSNALVGAYYFQAINKDGRHPAAARLWQEFLFSDEGQNLYLKGLARPVRADAMTTADTIDKTALGALPAVQGTPVVPTDAQSKSIAEYLDTNWAKAVN
ncbi:ABC transporter substrate-binding protein [Mycolicibacterium komossense]|uniref:ABC transporter substrate-binding protein n=1 Tax=Mycolicibacterium komossense TaxID=1779 RepID=A0ABT3CHR5_9MYCO|nr:substrate-binding domain-containing protein [Mycolicibacterium komossense]MCV7229029.1 ABC transporter substrate-binding protein [Mycolicibacterium komossense]